MIRFSAGEAEIEALLRFMARRIDGLTNSGRESGRMLLMTPLAGRSRDDLRFRRTPRPLLTRLKADDRATAWGLRSAEDRDAPLVASRRGDALQVDPEASRLIVLQLGPARGKERRRDGLLEARDWTEPGVMLSLQGAYARDLVERCARRIRRRGRLSEGRWRLLS